MRLNLARIFTREEPVAGLEIRDNVLRLLLLETDKKTSAIKVSFLAEEPLAAGIIVNGAVQNAVAFGKILQGLAKRFPSKVRYVVASIPSDHTYSKTFSFPKTIQGQKLEDSIKLTIGFQLPFKPEDVYLDWEKIESKDNSEIFLVAAPKTIINAYIETLNAAKLNPIAIEFYPLSFLRAVRFPSPGPVLIESTAATSSSFYVVEGGVLRFSRTVPASFVADKQLDAEKRKIMDFYEADQGKFVAALNARDLEPASVYNEARLSGTQGTWAVAIGAALRGIAPRSGDTAVSLMPVGTEQAYEYHKAIIFSQFIANLAIGISIFFSAAFAGAWLFTNSFQATTSRQLESLGSLPIPTDAAELEARATGINGLVQTFAEAQKGIPRLSVALKEIRSLAGTGILVTGLGIPSARDSITLAGIAKNRDNLDTLKKTLSESTFFADARFSGTNLAQLADIPFSATMRIANPDALYGNSSPAN
jgi:hypothetical protein